MFEHYIYYCDQYSSVAKVREMNTNQPSLCDRGFETDNDVLMMADLLFSLEEKYGKQAVLDVIKKSREDDYEDYEIIELLIVRNENSFFDVVTMTTIQERHRMCGTCYAGRTGSCSSRYCNNGQTDRCMVAYRKQSSGVV